MDRWGWRGIPIKPKLVGQSRVSALGFRGKISYQTNNYVVPGSFAHSEQVKYGLTADAVSAGVNYHFGQGYGPLK